MNSLQKFKFDLSKDPEWNDNIAEDNPDIYDELFKKIEFDAKWELLMNFSIPLKDSVDW